MVSALKVVNLILDFLKKCKVKFVGGKRSIELIALAIPDHKPDNA